MKGSFLTGAQTADPISIGIDIGTSVAKLIVAKRSADRIAIRHTGAFRVPKEHFEDGVVSNPRAVGKLIREWADKVGVQGTKTVFSIPNGTAALRWVALPAMDDDER